MNTGKLNPIESAQYLLQGSRNLDRMKKDITDLTQLLLGLVTLKLEDTHPCDFQFKWSALDHTNNVITGTWYINGRVSNTRCVDNVLLKLYDATESCGPNSEIFFSTVERPSLKMKHIELTYNCLPSLVTGLCEKIPIQELWSPILRAAEQKFFCGE